MTRNEIVLKHYYLVRQTLVALHVDQDTWDDAWGAASLALVECADRWDPKRGATLRNYLIGCMRVAVLDVFYRRRAPDAAAARACHSKAFGDVESAVDADGILRRLPKRFGRILIGTYCLGIRPKDSEWGQRGVDIAVRSARRFR